MLPNNQKFYRPYESLDKSQSETRMKKYEPYQSDDDTAPSDTDSGSVTTTTSSKEELPNFAVFATNLQLNEAGGQNLPTTDSQLEYGLNELNRDVPYAPFKAAFDIDLPFKKTSVVAKYEEKIWKDDNPRTMKTITSIIMLNSGDRDRNVYPTPANLTLRLPRIYLNVTSLQIVQMKLLSSFLYFTKAKKNTSITINEFGRIYYNYLGLAQGTLNITNHIREGTYNINTLIAELTIQLNTPPIFYDYPGGFNQFVPLFIAAGYFGLAFNYPGDYFYDSLNRQYIPFPTMTYIITRYWATTNLGFTPSLNQTKQAYYYPVLREYVLDPDYGINFLNVNIDTTTLLAGETLYTRIVYAYQGVNDPIVLQMVDLNLDTLDKYRSEHTFRNALINSYIVGYESFNNRMYIQSPSLNTSLVNLLNTQYQIFFNDALLKYGITQPQYDAIVASNAQLLSIVNSMYDYIQQNLAIYFGIDFNTFAPIYFTTGTNYLNIQNAINAIGVSSNYDFKVIKKGNTPITKNIIEVNRNDPPYYWPNMSNVPYDPVLGTNGYPTNLGLPLLASPTATSNYPYNISLDNFDFSNSFVDAQGDVFIDQRRKAGDIITPIAAARYTVFKFRSLYRQTLQVETMPRPTQYRYPAYNLTDPLATPEIKQFFDNSYSFVFNANNIKMDNVPFASLNLIPGFSTPVVTNTTNFGIDYFASEALWGSNSKSLNIGSNAFNFVFYLPLTTAGYVPPAPPAVENARGYKHRMALTLSNYNSNSYIPAATNIYLYQDRAAFMADLSGNARNENPLHYKNAFYINSNINSFLTCEWTAYAGQTYYAIVRSSNISFESYPFQLIAWYPDGTTFQTLSTSTAVNPYSDPTTASNLSNYLFAQVDDPDFIRLPTSSNLWGINPTGNEVNQGLVISNVPIGYDNLSNVSNDLTDYVGYVANITRSNILPTATIRVDPTTGYFFQVGSAYNTTTQTYFYPGASNFLLQPANQASYTSGTVAYRQFKIVQWYDTNYLPEPQGTSNPYNSNTDLTPNIPSYTVSTTKGVPISNYNYDITTGNIQLGLGCCGFSFVPSDGIWNIERVMFRSAFIQNDKNSNIKYLGVFLTDQANATPNFRLALSNAVAKLDLAGTTVYPNAGSVNFGFDGMLGTYYSFVSDPAFAQETISGFSQNASVLDPNNQDFYSILPFDANSNIVNMYALTGSPVPYPYICDASATRFYFDGVEAPNRHGMVVPRAAPINVSSIYGPPANTSYTMSAYEQSIQIGTQITHYLDQVNIVEDLSGFIPWQSIGYPPTGMYADVSGVMMIQSTDFKFYSYPFNTTTRTFTYLYNITVDQIYPLAENTTLVAAAGNSTKYVFLGFKVNGAAYQVRIKAYDVNTATLYDLNINSIYQIPDLTFAVNTFSFTDTQGIVISGTSGGTSAVTYRTRNSATLSPFIIDTYPAAFVNVKSIQPPASDTIYSLPLQANGRSQNYFYTVNEVNTSASRNTVTVVATSTTPSYYNNICVTRISGQGDQIFFLSPQTFLTSVLANAPSRFYSVKAISGTAPSLNANIEYSSLVFTSAPPGPLPYIPANMVGGANGSKWAYFNQPYYIWGNRNDNEDAPIKVQNAWQIFYPTTKIVLRKLANSVNPITDLSGLEYPEFPHTMMFAFNTKKAYDKYIDNSGIPSWGLESSGGLLPTNAYNLNSNGFLVSDPKFSGYYFNSYIFNVPLLPSAGTTYGSGNVEPFYYLAIRDYTPSEKSQVLVRFNLPQRYDFGFVRLRDLSNEPLLLSNAAIFNPSYASALGSFQSNFQFSNLNFGYSPSQGITGSNLNANGFGDFLRQYTIYLNQYNSNIQIIQNITSNVQSNFNNFITSNLIYILPTYALARTNYTAALQFSILWRSSLEPLYLKAEDQWGLGWNLGYAKANTPYATVQRAESFFKILDDYIYLKLNTQYDMNRMDTGGKENLKETTEPQGNILTYNAKLLLNTFGSYAQTIIQNPVYFNPPILKLDKMVFQWFDVVGNQITNAECEWNAAIQIVEEIPRPGLRETSPVIIPPQ
jgi:hypothetical protein